MRVLRQWRVLACFGLLAGCGNSAKPATTTPENVAADSTPAESPPESPAEPTAGATGSEDSRADAQAFSLPDPKCDAPIATYRGRAVVTINGVDSPNRVDIIAKAPEASAKMACELALKTHRMTSPIGQRALRECSTEAIAPDYSKAGWDLVNPTRVDGFGLLMLVEKADDVDLDPCTQVALVHLSNFSDEQACTGVVDSMAAARKRAAETSQAAINSFLDKELERESSNIKEKCPKVALADAECTAIHEVAKNVHVVCDKPASQGCTRAKEAVMLFESCRLRHRRLLRDCDSSKEMHKQLQIKRETPPEPPTDPVPYCRAASS